MFGQCLSYPHISTQLVEDVSRSPPKTNEPLTPTEPKEQVKRKVDLEKPIVKKQRKRKSDPTENQRVSLIPQPNKKQKQQKRTHRQRRKNEATPQTFTYDWEPNDNSYHLYDI